MENIQQQQLLKEELIQKYLDSLNEKELKACKLAENLLGMSFKIEKSIGFTQWLENNSSS